MPFSKYHSGFDEAALKAMCQAYDGVCDDLHIAAEETERRNTVEHVLVNIARLGELDPHRLKVMAKMQILKH